MKKIITIVGARPQFIKAAAVSRMISGDFSKSFKEVIVHTGQHFDKNMSEVFFEELDIPKPAINLAINGGGHGRMTGRMLEQMEEVLIAEQPDWVLVYGDTNSTLAGALAASKLHIPIAHVEAGLRSYNMKMPEEINRVVADRISNLLLCPTSSAIKNLEREGLADRAVEVGDVMLDVALTYREKARKLSRILEKLALRSGNFVLATVHRAENTGDAHRLRGIVDGIAAVARDLPVVLPLHPRTREVLERMGLLECLAEVKIVEPLPFLDMIALEQAAKVILTDSGGVQKEAFFYNIPCVTMRDETEWVETVELGWNTLVGANPRRIHDATLSARHGATGAFPYGDGAASERIVRALI